MISLVLFSHITVAHADITNTQLGIDPLDLVVEFSESRVTEFSQRMAGQHNLLVGLAVGAVIALPRIKRRRRFVIILFAWLCFTGLFYLYARMGYWSALRENALNFPDNIDKQGIMTDEEVNKTTVLYAKIRATFLDSSRAGFMNESF